MKHFEGTDIIQIHNDVTKTEQNYLKNRPKAKYAPAKNEMGVMDSKKDSVQISKEGLAALKESLSSRTKGVKITKSGNDYNVLFENVAYVYRAVKNGCIDIDGETLTLSDADKSELKKAADKSFSQMQKDTLTATAEHNAHVLQQQAEAIRSAGKEERDFLEMLLNDNDEDEWTSPLLRLENRSVSIDIEKTTDGFSVTGIRVTEQ